MNNYDFRFNPELLSTFLAVAEAGRVSAAAKSLHISQPSVTSHIRQLEEALGVQLFKRSVKGVELTAKGQKFHDKAKQIFSLINNAVHDIEGGHEPKGKLMIAASTTIADYVLPSLLSDFKKRYPLVQVSLKVQNTEEVLDLVREEHAPLGLVEGHARAASVHLEPFLEDELVLVVPSAWVASIRKTSDILNYPLLMREPGSGTRSIIEREFKKRNISIKNFKEVIEMGSAGAIKSAVAAELGVSFLSRISVQNEMALGKITTVPLPDLKMIRMFRWALPSGGLSPSAQEFYRFASGLQTRS
ncbi:LysR family transcriptional regulator [uncultured Bdellovibrio sp.]|uniref:LysR family transcriptional regulator n=1 Tax=Bdellovibrio sp. HCB-162 TaxID=3394234 RepID=UPI0025EF20FB|nr:LysR family transcriptional regulator [uncultured Bdellovibrio sp.]